MSSGIGVSTPARINVLSVGVLLDLTGATVVGGAFTPSSIVTPSADITTLDVTNIRALDGTACAVIANSTGVMTMSTVPVLSAGASLANGQFVKSIDNGSTVRQLIGQASDDTMIDACASQLIKLRDRDNTTVRLTLNTSNGLLTMTGDLAIGAGDIDFSAGGRVNFADSQSTVGAAGGASALPATPTGYILIEVAGTTRVVPFYNQA